MLFPSSDKDSAYRQGYLVEGLASCSSGPSSASDTSSLFSTSSGEPMGAFGSKPLAYDVLMHMRLIAAISICVNGRVEETHVRLLVVLIGLGKRVKMLHASSSIMGRDLMTELMDNLPDRLLLLFRSKLASRLRSDTGLSSITRMIKMVPSATVKKQRPGPKDREGHQGRVKGLQRSMSSLLDTQSSLGLGGMLDTSIDPSLDIMDSCDGIFQRRGSGMDKQPSYPLHQRARSHSITIA
ncbi:hypothetical protein WJX73_000159 [Symbiochloris irregularis]|uniref:Uncharacterized protein n=1 Tax=Symbiochloris irregularis TaxID=706552 RepID=A0AAW1NX78_9CHLO